MTDRLESVCPACGAQILSGTGRCACGNWYNTDFLAALTNPSPEDWQPVMAEAVTVFSDGSTASYYDFPPNLKQLQDLISYLNCNAQMGEIGRAWMRYGRCGHSERRRDLRKIIFYANAELDRLEKYENE